MNGKRPRFREILANRNFRLLWVGQIIASIGDRFYQFALLYVVLKLTPGGGGVGRESARVLFCGMFLTVLLAPWIGAFVDHHSRRAVMVFSDLGRALLVLAMLALWYETRSAPLIFAFIALAGLMTGLFIPARQAAVPLLVEPRQIVAANALVTTIGVIASLAGACAGFIVAIFGERSSFVVAALGFGISALMVSRIDRPLSSGNPSQVRPEVGWAAVRATARGAWCDEVVRLLFVLNGAAQFVAGLFVVFVLEHAATNLDLGWIESGVAAFARGVADLGFKKPVVEVRLLAMVVLLLSTAVGLVIGVVAAGRLWRLAHRKVLPVAMLGVLGASFLAFARAGDIGAAALGCIAIGAAGALLNIPVDARFQAHVPGASQGRIFAARSALNYLCFLTAVGLNLDGRLLHWRGAERVIVDLGWLCMAGALALAIAFPGQLKGSWAADASGPRPDAR